MSNFKEKLFASLITLPLKARSSLDNFTNISKIYFRRRIRQLIDKGYFPIENPKIVPTKKEATYQIRIKAKYVGRKQARKMYREKMRGDFNA